MNSEIGRRRRALGKRQAEEERRRVVVAESQVASDEWKEASRYEIAEAAIEDGMEGEQRKAMLTYSTSSELSLCIPNSKLARAPVFNHPDQFIRPNKFASACELLHQGHRTSPCKSRVHDVRWLHACERADGI